MITNKCKIRDIACEDGCCPDCNYYNFQIWQESHAHCTLASFDCPDPDDCPHERIPDVGCCLSSEQTEALRQKYL